MEGYIIDDLIVLLQQKLWFRLSFSRLLAPMHV